MPGKMEELKPGTRIPMADKQAWYSQLLHIAHSKGYSDGWVSHKMRERHGTWPRGLAQITTPPTAEVLSWVKSRTIAWSKSKGKT